MNPIRQFELILEISRCGSISKAAENLHISQPTLSKYLANIESQLGTELFDRTVIPLRLTASGEKYVTSGRKIIDEYRQLEKSLSDVRGASAAEIKIGISPTRAPYIIPRILNVFYSRAQSETKIVVVEHNMAELSSELLRGELDLVISIACDGTRQFKAEELFSEKVLLAVPQKYVNLDEMQVLTECPFITTGPGLRMTKTMSEILHSVGAREPVIEVQSIETALSLVESGIGAALAPSYIAESNKYRHIVFKEIPESIESSFKYDLDRTVCVFYRREQYLTDTEKEFIEICKTTCR